MAMELMEFTVTKDRHWFCVESPDGVEIQDASPRRLAVMMTNNIDIMDAYRRGSLKFDEIKISSVDEEEITSIIIDEVTQEELEYLGEFDDEKEY